MAKKTLLITRPLQDSLRCKQDYESLGLKIIILPALKITLLPMDIVIPKDNIVIITSTNTLPILKKSYNENQIFCVGEYTKKILNENNYNKTISTQNVQKLYDLIKDTVPIYKKITYLSGSEISFPLDIKLKNAGYDIKRIICYKNTPITICEKDIPKKIDIISFYSLNSLKTLINHFIHYNIQCSDMIALCISNRLGDIAKSHFKKVLTANNPTHQAMLEKIKQGIV